MKGRVFTHRTFRACFLIAAVFQSLFFGPYLSTCRAAGVDVLKEGQFQEVVRQAPDSVKGYLALANFYSDADEFVKAEDAFKKVLGINPSEDKAFVGLGMLYIRRDDASASLSKAIKLFARAIEINPKNAKALARWGVAVAERSRATANYASKKTVLEFMARTLEAYPSQVDIYESAVSCFEIFATGTFDSSLGDVAIWLAAKALALDPKLYEVRVSLADLYMMRTEYEQAREYLREALEIRPQRSDAYRILAQVDAIAGMPGPAEEAAKKALEINPNKGGAYKALAYVYESQGKTMESDQAIESMLALNPQRVDGLLQAVIFYFQVKNYSKMADFLARILKSNPENSEANLWHARLSLAQGSEEEAARSFQKAVALAPENETALAETASFYERRGDVDKARVFSQRALELGLKNKEMASFLRSALESSELQLKNREEASLQQASQLSSVVDDLRRKLRLNPRDQQTSVALASAYIKQGNLADAEGLLTHVVRLNPKNDEALAALGCLELGRKNKAKAESFFTRSLRINPKNKTALRGMRSVR